MDDNSPRVEEFDPTLTVDPEGRPILSFVDHMSRARRFRADRRPNLRFWRGEFYEWTDTSYYLAMSEDTIEAEIWDYLEHARTRDKEGKIKPFYPNRSSVGETLAPLKAVSQLDDRREAPYWIADELPGEMIVFPNGILDMTTDTFHPPNSNYFTLGALGFNYQPRRGEPVEWLKFLDQIFRKELSYETEPRDEDEAYDRLIEEAESVNEARDQIRALQEWFGYLLPEDISLEKCLQVIGPRRSGKGTIVNMMKALLASTAFASPKLGDLGSEFGLSTLINKRLAVIDDPRIGRGGEQHRISENVLKITGRGTFDINRKYLSYWHGVLLLKLVFIVNQMLRLDDDSPALAGRFIILITRTSFYGREDKDLFKKKLRPELVDVFHWALEGLRRLRAKGRFSEPATSVDERGRMAELGSLVRAFVAERCVLGEERSVVKAKLYEAYKQYAEMNNEGPENNVHFFSALYTATEGKVKATWPRENGKQVPSVSGIALDDDLPF